VHLPAGRQVRGSKNLLLRFRHQCTNVLFEVLSPKEEVRCLVLNYWKFLKLLSFGMVLKKVPQSNKYFIKLFVHLPAGRQVRGSKNLLLGFSHQCTNVLFEVLSPKEEVRCLVLNYWKFLKLLSFGMVLKRSPNPIKYFIKLFVHLPAGRQVRGSKNLLLWFSHQCTNV